jgi:hypothetical protein
MFFSCQLLQHIRRYNKILHNRKNKHNFHLDINNIVNIKGTVFISFFSHFHFLFGLVQRLYLILQIKKETCIVSLQMAM